MGWCSSIRDTFSGGNTPAGAACFRDPERLLIRRTVSWGPVLPGLFVVLLVELSDQIWSSTFRL
jgi:hypothetical protein